MAGSQAVNELKSRLSAVGITYSVENFTAVADPLLEQISLMIDSIDDQSVIQAAIMWALDSGDCPAGGEVVRYFAHRYQWPWLKEEVERKRADRRSVRDLRGERVYEWVLEAFDDDWDDADFYPSLQTGGRASNGSG
ncbi:hypothetical protein [Nocardia tenerifensis]|nr:hypothetical protein [Nocardia tenerifensis]